MIDKTVSNSHLSVMAKKLPEKHFNKNASYATECQDTILFQYDAMKVVNKNYWVFPREEKLLHKVIKMSKYYNSDLETVYNYKIPPLCEIPNTSTAILKFH